METIAGARPRCPYAVRGIDSAEMEGCPGYAPEPVLIGAERIVGSGYSCRHMRAQPDPRQRGAYVSACTHPLIGVPANGHSGDLSRAR